MSAQELKIRNHIRDYTSYLSSRGLREDFGFLRYLEDTADRFSAGKGLTSGSIVKRVVGVWRQPGLRSVRSKLAFAYRFYK